MFLNKHWRQVIRMNHSNAIGGKCDILRNLHNN
jgi:hypothetical protein